MTITEAAQSVRLSECQSRPWWPEWSARFGNELPEDVEAVEYEWNEMNDNGEQR